jgi:hypothetical protein
MPLQACRDGTGVPADSGLLATVAGRPPVSGVVRTFGDLSGARSWPPLRARGRLERITEGKLAR